MDTITSIILGLVQGITEYLPISSTGHLLIAEQLLHAHKSDAFNVCIQVGPIVAVVLVFWKDIIKLLTGFGDPDTRDYLFKLAASFILTCIAGVIVKKLGIKLPETVVPVAIAAIIGAVIIFFVEARTKGKTHSETVSWAVVVAIAAAQVLAAVFPGTSRSGATIIAGLMLGLSRPSATRFSFLVGIPTMFAAGALQIKDAVDAGMAAELMSLQSIIAFVVATGTAWLAVVWLLRYVQHRTFVPFAWYRLALGAALFAFVALRIIQ
jgi:undecaprenyl-diphosphatase